MEMENLQDSISLATISLGQLASHLEENGWQVESEEGVFIPIPAEIFAELRTRIEKAYGQVLSGLDRDRVTQSIKEAANRLETLDTVTKGTYGHIEVGSSWLLLEIARQLDKTATPWTYAEETLVPSNAAALSVLAMESVHPRMGFANALARVA